MGHTTRRSRAGFTLIEFLIIIGVIAILAALATPNMLASRRSANTVSAGQTLHMINSAETSYRSSHSTYAAMSDLIAANALEQGITGAAPGGSPKSGYYFSITVVSPVQYYVVAIPALQGGDQILYSDETAVIFNAPTGTPAPTSDAAGNPPTSVWTPFGN